MTAYEIHIKARIELSETSDDKAWEAAEKIAKSLPSEIYPEVYYLTELPK